MNLVNQSLPDDIKQKHEESIIKCDHLISLIEKGYEIISNSTSEKAIVILGDSGVGKTTLSAYLSGVKLEVQTVNGRKVLNLKDPNATPNLVISENKVAQTTIPTMVISKSGICIFDNPGFFDTDRTQEFANAFYIHSIFETRNELKLVLVMPDSYLNEKGAQFIRTVEHFSKMFKNPQMLKNCVTLLVSKIEIERQVEHIQSDIDQILEKNKNISGDIKLIIGYLRNSIEVFPKPPYPQDYDLLKNEDNNKLMKSLETNGEYFKTEKNSINVVISEECEKELANSLFDQRSIDLINTLTMIARLIDDVCKSIQRIW